jgi:3-hydroxyacyl-CoA dehydrogenase
MHPPISIPSATKSLQAVEICSDKTQTAKRVAQKAAEILRTHVRDGGGTRVLVATGNSQLEMIGFLAGESGIEWSKVEAFHLVEAGIADIETVDRSFRNDMGWWALLAGPFRWMDLTGIPAYGAVREGLLPKLCKAKQVPKLMRDTVASGAKGIANAKGFYPYTKKSARRWEKDWVEFTYDMRKLADKYAKRRGERNRCG